MNPKTKNMIINIGLLAAALGPLIFALGTLGLMGKGVLAFFALLKVATIGATVQGTLMTLAYAALPLLFLAGAAAIAIWLNDLKNFVNGNKSAVGEILDSWGAFGDIVGAIIHGVNDGLNAMIEKIVNFWHFLANPKQGIDLWKKRREQELLKDPISPAQNLFKGGSVAPSMGGVSGGSSQINNIKVDLSISDGTSTSDATNIVTDGVIGALTKMNNQYKDALTATAGMV